MMETVMWTPWGDPAPKSLEGAIRFKEPPVKDGVTPGEQVAQIVADLQSEGLIGLVERTEILRRYPEYCWMHGWMPMAENHLFAALGRVVRRKRPMASKLRITCYVIPAPLAAQTAHRASLMRALSAQPLGQGRLQRAA